MCFHSPCMKFDAAAARFVVASSRGAGDSSQSRLLRLPAPPAADGRMLSKIAYTAFVVLVCVIWLRHYGWRNFLWFSDIAFIGAVPALWLESAALASVLAVAVLLPEILWNVDFVARLLLRRRITGLTDYMFEPERSRLLRGLSLFHVPLPLVLLWMVASTVTTRRSAWWAQSSSRRSSCRGVAQSARRSATSTGPTASGARTTWSPVRLHGAAVRGLRRPRLHPDPLPAARHSVAP